MKKAGHWSANLSAFLKNISYGKHTKNILHTVYYNSLISMVKMKKNQLKRLYRSYRKFKFAIPFIR